MFIDKRIDALEQALHEIVSWSEAYPLAVFPEPDFKKARALLEAGGITLDAVSASCMRHVVTGVGDIARRALAGDRPMAAPRKPTEEAFAKFVNSLFVKRRSGADGYMHAAIGLAGESGELLDLFKKHWVYGKDIDVNKVLEEMGDVLHYFTMLCILMDVSWQDVMDNNVAKLLKRYPQGYTDAAAIARADQRPSVIIGGDDHYNHDNGTGC